MAFLYFDRARKTFDPGGLEKYYAALSVKPAAPVDSARVREGISAATGYLRRVNDENGRFEYLVNMDPGLAVKDKYNLLRHAGTIYSLGMAYSVEPNSETLDVMRRAVNFMRDCCVSVLGDGEMAGVSEPIEITGRKGSVAYLLGGAGLGLVALASLKSIDANFVSDEEMRRLANFGQYMQRRSGEFYAKYVPGRGGGRSLPGASLYYPGEMALAWLKFYEHTPSADLIDSTIRALTFLAGERAKEGAAPSDHWALLATAKLFEIAEREQLDIPYEALFNHALQVCHAIIEEGHVHQLLPVMEGALVANGVVTPTATRLEGLLAALTFLPQQHPMRHHVEAAVDRGIDFLLRAQVKGGELDGAFPFAITRVPESPGAGAAAFNAQVGEVRIDYVQHSLSALVQYLEWTRQGER